jgi:hypothetical protein
VTVIRKSLILLTPGVPEGVTLGIKLGPIRRCTTVPISRYGENLLHTSSPASDLPLFLTPSLPPPLLFTLLDFRPVRNYTTRTSTSPCRFRDHRQPGTCREGGWPFAGRVDTDRERCTGVAPFPLCRCGGRRRVAGSAELVSIRRPDFGSLRFTSQRGGARPPTSRRMHFQLLPTVQTPSN